MKRNLLFPLTASFLIISGCDGPELQPVEHPGSRTAASPTFMRTNHNGDIIKNTITIRACPI